MNARRKNSDPRKYIDQREFDEHMRQLTRVRAPDNPPTEKEVIEMMLRIKKRWHIL